MKKPQIVEAYDAGTPLLYSRSAKWADGYGLTKVTVTDGQPAHWLYNMNTQGYDKSQCVSYGSRKTKSGYLVTNKDGLQMVATAMQLRGTWDDCQKVITDNNEKAKDAAEREQVRREAFYETSSHISSFGLHVRGWDVRKEEVTVSATELLALLREMMGAAQQ